MPTFGVIGGGQDRLVVGDAAWCDAAGDRRRQRVIAHAVGEQEGALAGAARPIHQCQHVPQETREMGAGSAGHILIVPIRRIRRIRQTGE
jgi:hypothetical protein